MKSKVSELFNEHGLRSHRFIRTGNDLFSDSEQRILPIVWATKARKSGNLSGKNTHCLKMFAMDEEGNMIDASLVMSGFENYLHNENSS